MKKNTVFLIGLLSLFAIAPRSVEAQPFWPEITQTAKPWTRWWWHGSAVNAADLTANLEELKNSGFGGVEITPIYDVKCSENLTISFQSSDWMKAFQHTLSESKRLGLGVDLANASGWPFGGPWIQEENACKNVQYKVFTLQTGERLTEKITFIQQPLVRAVGHKVDIEAIKFPVSSNTNLQELALDQVRFGKPLPLQTVMAYSDKGDKIDLTHKVLDNGTLDWQAPEGNWQLYAIFQGWHGKMVERAGTGGEGNVIDHFSEKAIRDFLQKYDVQSKDFALAGLRAFFNDSYEVDDAQGQADWTPLFFDEFKTRRGYDLKAWLPALFGNDTKEINNRVLCDYRETISDLILERFTRVWGEWANGHQAIIRNQAHGSPANILDLYQASDIPETEGTDPMRIKMASSSAHISGKPLIACEATTWLDEHFTYDLADVKQNLDRYLAHGVNHIVYHGTPYSPQSAQWPGWMFYASAHFAPTNTWWNDLKAVNEYTANCQSFMQQSTPDNDFLLYWPIYDAWSEPGRTRLRHFGEHSESLTKALSESLLNKGYLFDYISDKQLQQLRVLKGKIKSEGATYKAILVPSCQYIPLSTMAALIQLAESGAVVLFQDSLPDDVPGLARLQARQDEFQQLKKSLQFDRDDNLLLATKGSGKLLIGQPEALLAKANIEPEALMAHGLWVNRVLRSDGTCYFISNWSDKKIDQWITIQSSGKEAVWFNPMNRQTGKAKTEKIDNKTSKLYLQLAPGETLILQWYASKVKVPVYHFWQEASVPKVLNGEWEIAFTKGGPTLPTSLKTDQLQSWPEISDELKRFSGTACYRLNFDKPTDGAVAYQLDLGKVWVSAAVYLNDEKLATLIGPKYQLTIHSAQLKGINRLEVRVTNLMANRIIDMEKRGENYKYFYNINFAANRRENLAPDGTFTAINWKPFDSGMLGPVTLTPLQPVKPETK